LRAVACSWSSRSSRAPNPRVELIEDLCSLGVTSNGVMFETDRELSRGSTSASGAAGACDHGCERRPARQTRGPHVAARRWVTVHGQETTWWPGSWIGSPSSRPRSPSCEPASSRTPRTRRCRRRPDPPGTPRQPKEPTGRARGGQPSHKGHKRELLPADRVVLVVPSCCSLCHHRLHGRDPAPPIYQVVELPEFRPDVTNYELHELGCECGARTRRACPPGVPQGAFGPRLTAAVALCTSRFHMPKRLAQEFLRDSSASRWRSGRSSRWSSR